MGEPCYDQSPTTRGRRIPARTLKSPLAAPGHATQTDVVTAGSALTASVQSPLTDRESTLAEFEGYLRTVNHRDGRPYEEKTISVYSVPAKNLDGWLTGNGIDGDFTVVDTALLNRYFREYYVEHGQGGTHTLQRNLIQLFNFLERERGLASPYTDGLTATPPSRDGRRPCPLSSSMTCSRSPGAGEPGTSRRPATTR
jgi:integrase/recombinase XerD